MLSHVKATVKKGGLLDDPVFKAPFQAVVLSTSCIPHAILTFKDKELAISLSSDNEQADQDTINHLKTVFRHSLFLRQAPPTTTESSTSSYSFNFNKLAIQTTLYQPLNYHITLLEFSSSSSIAIKIHSLTAHIFTALLNDVPLFTKEQHDMVASDEAVYQALSALPLHLPRTTYHDNNNKKNNPKLLARLGSINQLAMMEPHQYGCLDDQSALQLAAFFRGPF
jgi:hypothetical protein